MQKINSSLKKSTYLKAIGLGLMVLSVGYMIIFGFVLKNKETVKNIFKETTNHCEKTGCENKTETNTTNNKICKGNTCFDIEYAITPKERQNGLMFRKSIPEGSGMMFVFETEGTHKFWMKNTLITLDMLRLDSKYKVIYIEKNVPPCKEISPDQTTCPTYGPNENSEYVLEINGGLSEKYGIITGDILTHN